MEEQLKQANIPKEWWVYCKIENGVIKTPSIEVLYKNGLATEEQYNLWKQSNKIDILSVKQKKIQESKELLAIWLANNPLVSKVHGQEATYTVTAEKQSLLTQNILLAQLKQVSTTTWNCQGGVCEEWTVQELSQLALEIEAYIRPRIKKQQQYEVQINACTTVEEVETIEIQYETV